MCGWEVRGVTQHHPKTIVIKDVLHVGFRTPNEQRIPLNQIVAVGEHTDQSGPYFEDYWLTIVLRDGRSVKIGSEDPDSSALYEQLGNALTGTAFSPGLCDQTSFASRILWPLEHQNAPLLDSVSTDGNPLNHLSTVTQKLLADGGYVQ